MAHLASWPPKCAECGKFMHADNSRIERRDHGAPWYGVDDYETGICNKCKASLADNKWKERA